MRTFALPEAVRRNLIEYRNRSERPYAKAARPEDDRWIHQKQALARFFEERHGILEMATGTGKTRTSISIMNELFERGSIKTALISAFGTDLLDQWYAELAA